MSILATSGTPLEGVHFEQDFLLEKSIKKMLLAGKV